jgi:peroxiredoxin
MRRNDGPRHDSRRIVHGLCILATLVLTACPDPNGGAGSSGGDSTGSTAPRTVTVQLAYVAQMPPWGSSYDPTGRTLSETPPSTVTTPPSGGRVFYGELQLLGSVRYVVAVALPASGASGGAQLYLDANRDGNMTNDAPAHYDGTGTLGTAAEMEFPLPRPNGTTSTYRIWLWTTLRLDATPGANETFNYYARCHKKGDLTLDVGTGAVTVAVRAGDSANGATFANTVLNLDWNGNSRDEDPDWLTAGTACWFRGFTISLDSIAAYSDSAVFTVTPSAICPADVTDIDSALAMLPIVGNRPPALDVPDIDGATVSLADYAGKVLLIDFWATWCGPCLAELPNVKSTYAQYHSQGFEIVGVSLDSSVATLRTFLAANSIAWRQICDTASWNGTLPTRYDVDGIPATVLVGRDGIIVALDARGSQLATLVGQEVARSAP